MLEYTSKLMESVFSVDVCNRPYNYPKTPQKYPKTTQEQQKTMKLRNTIYGFISFVNFSVFFKENKVEFMIFAWYIRIFTVPCKNDNSV